MSALDGQPFDLGDRVRDSVTGFEGVAVAYSEYLYRSPLVLIARKDGNGKPEEVWLDAGRVASADGTRTRPGFGGRD